GHSAYSIKTIEARLCAGLLSIGDATLSGFEPCRPNRGWPVQASIARSAILPIDCLFACHVLRLPQCVPQWVCQALVNELDHQLLFLTPEGQRVGTIE